MSRIETDSLGQVEVPDEAYWGAQTQRSLVNFAIGTERMPLAVLHAPGADQESGRPGQRPQWRFARRHRPIDRTGSR